MEKDTNVPLFVSLVSLLIGCYDLLRGFMHTFNLEYSALYIAKLNLATPQASDLLRLLGVFGVSNFITGAMLILVAFAARGLALIMLLIVPLAYAVGMITIRYNATDYAPSHAAWGGMTPMMVYLTICIVTFVAGLIGTLYNKSNSQY
ncbi:MAG: hypothetical protein P1U32_07705 [Legionellaceae bacterium]|nr:hypothetical protein [Legionellaceae bacterium]